MHPHITQAKLNSTEAVMTAEHDREVETLKVTLRAQFEAVCCLISN